MTDLHESIEVQAVDQGTVTPIQPSQEQAGSNRYKPAKSLKTRLESRRRDIRNRGTDKCMINGSLWAQTQQHRTARGEILSAVSSCSWCHQRKSQSRLTCRVCRLWAPPARTQHGVKRESDALAASAPEGFTGRWQDKGWTVLGAMPNSVLNAWGLQAAASARFYPGRYLNATSN